MGEAAPIILFVLLAIAVVGGMIYAYMAAAKRRDALALYAMQSGYEFYSTDPYCTEDLYECFSLMTRGHSREVTNLICGKIDRYDLRAFDYRYKTGSGKDESTHTESVVVVDTDVGFPSLLIRPEGLFDHLAGAIGFHDIDFESDEFSRRFYVKSADKKFAYEVVSQKMMDFLLANHGWSTELAGRSILVHTGGTFTVEQFKQGIAFIRGFLGLLPDYLLESLRGAT